MTNYTPAQLEVWAGLEDKTFPLPNLARLVLEKEKEIARKDAALNQIDALCPSREILAMMHPGAMTKLVLTIGDIVSATLACGVLADRQAMKETSDE